MTNFGLQKKTVTTDIKKRILIAEIVNLIGFYLKRYGYKPWIMDSINEAMETVERLIQEKPNKLELVPISATEFQLTAEREDDCSA
jgi:hypothetical protein